MTDVAQSIGGKKKKGIDSILGMGGDAISNSAIAPSATGETKNKKPRSILGTLGGSAEKLGGV